MRADQNHAFTAVIVKEPAGDHHYGLGFAQRDQQGYWPVEGPSFPTYDGAKTFAADLNEADGVSTQDALLIVASSMRPSPQR
jgi:hypothetical protein